MLAQLMLIQITEAVQPQNLLKSASYTVYEAELAHIWSYGVKTLETKSRQQSPADWG